MLGISACSGPDLEIEVGSINEALTSQCGGTWDVEGVEQLTGALPISEEFALQTGRPIGRFINPVAGTCSSILVGDDLLLTNGHCVPNESLSSNARVEFNYQEDPNGVLRTVDTYPVVEVLEYQTANPDLAWAADYAIVRVSGSPAATWGRATVALAGPEVGDALAMIGHPDGGPKQIATGSVTGMSGRYLNLDIDAASGNSGSGLFNPDTGELVGVFFRAGCEQPDIDYNGGLSMTSLLQLSPILTELANNPPGTGDDDQSVDPVLSMEDSSLWTITNGNVSTDTTTTTDGAASMRLVGNNYTSLFSPYLSTDQFTSNPTQVTIDIEISSEHANPYWMGALQLLMDIESAGIYNEWVSQVELTNLSRDEFHTVSFNLPWSVQNALQDSRSDVQLRFALVAPGGAGPYYLDNINFQ